MSEQFLASAAGLFRRNGSGRLSARIVGDSGWVDLGDVDSTNISFAVEKSNVKSNRTAAKGVAIETIDSTELAVSFVARECSEFNLGAVFQTDDWQDSNQAAGFRALAEFSGLVADRSVDLGHRDPSVTKVSHGTVSGGPFEVGETVTGGTSSATGVVAWADADYVELVNVSGAFQAGETITGGTSSASAAASGVETLDDVVVVDSATPTTRYVLGVDYDLDPEIATIRLKSSGSISGNPFIAYNYPALTGRYAYLLSGSSRIVEFRFISDKGDQGPRMQIESYRASMTLDGDVSLIGQGGDMTTFPFTVTFLADSSKPTAQQYGKITMLKAA